MLCMGKSIPIVYVNVSIDYGDFTKITHRGKIPGSRYNDGNSSEVQ